jgi:hypothetical protein
MLPIRIFLISLVLLACFSIKITTGLKRDTEPLTHSEIIIQKFSEDVNKPVVLLNKVKRGNAIKGAILGAIAGGVIGKIITEKNKTKPPKT